MLMHLTACNSIWEDPGCDENGGEQDRTCWLSLRIYDVDAQEASDTRAGIFDSDADNTGSGDYIFNVGLAQERALYRGETGKGPHLALLFDEKGNKLGDFLQLSEWVTEGEPYTTLYTSTKENDFVKNQPGGVILVVLNAGPDLLEKLSSETTYKTYEDIAALTVGPDGADDKPTDFLYLKAEDGTRYFTMSSSMVVKNGAVVPANPLPSGEEEFRFYDTKEQALAHPLLMYVERLQSKYTLLFRLDQDEKANYFAPEGTGEETDQYHPVTKNLVYTAGTDFTPWDRYKKLRYVRDYTRSESIDNRKKVVAQSAEWKVNITGWGLNALEKKEYLFKRMTPDAAYFNGWQSDAHPYRTFWAEDPNYAAGVYPDQFRPATGVRSWTQETPLNYFSYDELAGKEVHRYSPENTFAVPDADAFASTKAWLRAGTHLIVTAQLLIEGLDDTSVYAGLADAGSDGLLPAASKFCMNDIWWSETAWKEYVAEYLGYWMLTDANQDKNRFGPNNGIFYVDQNGNMAHARHFDIASADIPGGDGWVWLKPNTDLYTFDGQAYWEIGPELYEKLAFDHQELMARHYRGGRMYYPVAVKHNRKDDSTGDVATGDYGAVRNHWYYLTISDIYSPGAPVDVPGQKIIPNNEPEEDGLGVNIRLLEWHGIYTDVSVDDQKRPGSATNNVSSKGLQ